MTNRNEITIGAIIEAARKARGLTQKDLAIRSGFSQSAISQIGNGARSFTEQYAESISRPLGGNKLVWLGIQKEVEEGSSRTIESFLTETLKISPSKPIKVTSESAMRRLTNDDIYKIFWEDRGSASHTIDDFDPRRIQSTSYDTRIGYLGELEDGDFNLILTPVEIPAKSLLRIRTREVFDIPDWIEAEIKAPSTIAKKFLSIDNGPIIDPGFNGPLTVTVENKSDKPAHISPDEPFLTIRFSVLGIIPSPNEEFRTRNSLDLMTDEDVFGDKSRPKLNVVSA